MLWAGQADHRRFLHRLGGGDARVRVVLHRLGGEGKVRGVVRGRAGQHVGAVAAAGEGEFGRLFYVIGISAVSSCVGVISAK